MAHTTTGTDFQAVTVEHIDPWCLLVDVNVRHDTRLDKDFVASIKEHGVLVPIVAVRTLTGTCGFGSVTGAPLPQSSRAATRWRSSSPPMRPPTPPPMSSGSSGSTPRTSTAPA